MSPKKPPRTKPKPSQRPPRAFGIIAARVRLARNAAKLTQFELAKETGITTPKLSAIEGGHKDVNARTVALLARALHVSSDYLLGLTDSL